MQLITKEQWEEIERMYQPGDAAAIARESDIPDSTIYLHIKQRKCSLKTAKAILKFYKNRREELKELLGK